MSYHLSASEGLHSDGKGVAESGRGVATWLAGMRDEGSGAPREGGQEVGSRTEDELCLKTSISLAMI